LARTDLEEAMTFVTVFRHIPRPIIGMIGDRTFEALEANLDWLARGLAVIGAVAAVCTADDLQREIARVRQL
jgi:hypothetical protein